jgi:Zn-finger nucleic acid-binding protein
MLVYACPNCKGRWFPRNALSEAKDRTDDDLRWIDFDPFGKEADKFQVPSRGKLCPECSTAMTSLTYETSKVVIDKCSRCRGIWLDHGEFEKIVKYLEQVISAESASDYAKDAFRKFLEIGTATKSKIAEIRDFLVVMKLLEERVAVEHPRLAAVLEKIYEFWPLK